MDDENEDDNDFKIGENFKPRRASKQQANKRHLGETSGKSGYKRMPEQSSEDEDQEDNKTEEQKEQVIIYIFFYFI